MFHFKRFGVDVISSLFTDGVLYCTDTEGQWDTFQE